MVKMIAVLVAVILAASIAFAETTFTVVDGKAVITETVVGKQVQMQGRNGQITNAPAKQDITTIYDPITKEQAQVQIIQLNTKKANIISKFNKDIAVIDAQIKLMKDVDTALPEAVVEEPIE